MLIPYYFYLVLVGTLLFALATASQQAAVVGRWLKPIERQHKRRCPTSSSSHIIFHHLLQNSPQYIDPDHDQPHHHNVEPYIPVGKVMALLHSISKYSENWSLKCQCTCTAPNPGAKLKTQPYKTFARQDKNPRVKAVKSKAKGKKSLGVSYKGRWCREER